MDALTFIGFSYVLSLLIISLTKVNRLLSQHCMKDYEIYRCKKGETSHGQVAQLLICLGQAIADGE